MLGVRPYRIPKEVEMRAMQGTVSGELRA
jgi:hypothetical protein